MPDDDAEPSKPPVLRYIADSKAKDNRLASAQNAADQVGLSLNSVAGLLVELTGPPPTAEEIADALWLATTARWPSPGAMSGSAVTASSASGDFAQAWDEIKTHRYPDMEKLSSKLPKNRAEISANQIILVAVLLVAAIYPVLPPEVQKYLTTEAGLMSALAAILALIKSERKKK